MQNLNFLQRDPELVLTIHFFVQPLNNLSILTACFINNTFIPFCDTSAHVVIQIDLADYYRCLAIMTPLYANNQFHLER